MDAVKFVIQTCMNEIKDSLALVFGEGEAKGPKEKKNDEEKKAKRTVRKNSKEGWLKVQRASTVTDTLTIPHDSGIDRSRFRRSLDYSRSNRSD